ncbi:MAG: hypothetical protein GX620_05865 [Chloroflexi bacterium]|nr:hypothetical protein [Chloroflexota bacterium]
MTLRRRAFVINLFNLSDESRVISGTLSLDDLGIERDLWYVTPGMRAGSGFDPQAGTYTASRRLEPWSAQVVEVRALEAEARDAPTAPDSEARTG